MIISESNKFIFVKPVKSAGTSIEVSLALGCKKSDFISETDYSDSVLEIEKNIFLNRKNCINLKDNFFVKLEEHAILKTILFFTDVLKKNNKLTTSFEEFNKISVIRNPWDRVLSYYNYDIATNAHRINGYDEITFDKYLQVTNFRHSCWEFYSIDNLFKIDTILLFEDLENTFKKTITKKYQIELTKTKFKSFSNKKEPYWKFYNDSEAELVYKSCKKEIDFFGYEFGKIYPKNFL